MKFAGVEAAPHELLIPLIETAGVRGDGPKSPEWWYEAYLHLVNDEQFARSPRSFFVERRLIPGSSGQLLSVPGEDGLLVCLHPGGNTGSRPVPPLFARTFAFVDRELSSLIENGPDEISSWVLSHFHISRFEASELIPRAIRSVVPKLFDGSLPAQSSDIVLAWRFVKALVESSRFTFSDDFWATIGRLPVYSDSADFADNSPSGPLIPCSAAYWPGELLPSSSPISGTESVNAARNAASSRFASFDICHLPSGIPVVKRSAGQAGRAHPFGSDPSRFRKMLPHVFAGVNGPACNRPRTRATCQCSIFALLFSKSFLCCEAFDLPGSLDLVAPPYFATEVESIEILKVLVEMILPQAF